MAIEVQLQDFQGNVLDRMWDSGFLIPPLGADVTHLLVVRYIDPYGKTLLNHLHADDLLADLDKLASLQAEYGYRSEDDERCRNRLAQFAARLKAGNVYLYFEGD